MRLELRSGSQPAAMQPLQFDDHRLWNDMQRLAPPLRVIFAAACAERLMGAFVASSADSTRSTAAGLRKILTRLWEDLGGARLPAHVVSEAIDTCMHLISKHGDPSGGLDGPSVEDAGVAVTHALRCRQDGDSHEAVSAARCAYEELLHLVEGGDNDDEDDEQAELRAVEHPIVQTELGRQARDLAELQRVSSPDIRDIVERIRTRAQEDARTIVRGTPTGGHRFWTVHAPPTATAPATSLATASAMRVLDSASVAVKGVPPGGPAPGFVQVRRGVRRPAATERAFSGSAIASIRGADVPSSRGAPLPHPRQPARDRAMDPKTKTEPPTKNLSAFVRVQPSELSHKDVVAQGKSQGRKLTEAYVARVRNRAAHAARAGEAKPSDAPKPSKSEFVRAHPKLTAAEIVTRAKDAGMVFTSSYVNKVRSGDRKRSRRPRKIKVEAVARLETRESVPVKRKPGRPKTLAVPASAESLAVPAAARPTRDAPARERAITLVPSRAPSTVLRHRNATSPSLENTLRAVIGELGLQRALLIFEEEHARVRALTET